VSDYIPKSRVTAESLRRSVARSIHVCAQAKVIDEQRAELENFAYALAHDFKQPIRQIKIFSQMISDSVRSREGEDIENYLAFLTAAASRLGKLVDVMSQYTLLNETPELADVDLKRVLANVRDSLTPYLLERGASFITPARAPVVHGNETLLMQVLQNLVMNGLQYNQSPVPQVEVRFRREGSDHVIDLCDNGVGIAPEYLAEIFKPLVRLHAASEFPGTGLGLTLARKAAQVQNGAITCSSAPGAGSTFHVRVPAAKASGKSAAEPARAAGRA
jgi:light-regulated signal transduction histidine kinase (bacteriophytochrome)